MRKKWILGTVALTAVAGTAFGAATVFGGGSEERPAYATVELKVRPTPQTARPQAEKARKRRKPTIGYFVAPTATVDSAVTGRSIDIEIGPCPGNRRVIEGGIVASDLSVDMQGTFVDPRARTYHVLIEDEDAIVGPFRVDAQLTCMKGIRG
jgi:hypothetical protein